MDQRQFAANEPQQQTAHRGTEPGGNRLAAVPRQRASRLPRDLRSRVADLLQSRPALPTAWPAARVFATARLTRQSRSAA